MRSTILAGLLLVVGLVATNDVGAQAVGANPHGELPDGLTCTSCHTTEGWTPLRSDLAFDHTDTRFPLDGRHEQSTCASCHVGLVFNQADVDPQDCASCHVDVHLGTLTQTCASCHSTETFSELLPGIVHPADFPLEGAHLQTSCESCHTGDLGGAYAPLDRECATCHIDEYVNVPLVDHEALGFSTDCTECHSTLDFRDVAFDHFTISAGFELRGQHAAVECTACHSLPGGGLPVIPSSPDDCVACHQDDYDDEHAGSGFPTDCTVCHNGDDWDDAEFDHAAGAGFELIPNHDLLDCVACHIEGSSATLWNPSDPQDCVACHLSDYNDEHAGSGFPTDCTDCHQITTWDGATFDHTTAAGFELIPNHDQLDCVACHIGSSSETFFNPSDPQDCVACHQSDYDGEHAGTGFSTSCTDCHQITTWSGAVFDHATTANFELVPNHDQLNCSACHLPNSSDTFFSPSDPQDCVACHQQDYSDEHAGTDFPDDCTVCHRTTTWGGAPIDHSFQINSGPHREEWNDCSDCHTTAGDYAAYTCLTCHRKPEMDDKHREENGYAYDSPTCLSCHPVGRN